MLKYRCRKCKRTFEASIIQARCTTLSCQSRQIKDITPSHKGVTYRNLEWTMEYEGLKTELKRHK